MTASPSTAASALVFRPQPGHTARSQMQALIFSGHKASARCQNGWMITYSSAYSGNTSRHTMPFKRRAQSSLQETEACWWRAVENGTMDLTCQTGGLKSSTKMHPSPFSTFHRHPHVQSKMPASLTASKILTDCPKFSGSPGSAPKTSYSLHAPHSSGSSGTLTRIPSPFLRRRQRNTWERFGNGRPGPHTPCNKSRSFTGSSYTLPWSYLQVEPTSYPSKICFPSSIIVLTCLAPHPRAQTRICAGGKPVSPNPPSLDPSQGPSKSLTPRLTQMLTLALASRFGSAAGGGHGASSWDGKEKTKTSAGQKQSAWNSSLSRSSISAQKATASKFSVTTEVSSRAGGRGGAGTKPPTPSSNAFMSSPQLQSA